MNGHNHGPAAAMDIHHHRYDGGGGGGGLAGRVSRFFRIEERGSSIGREIRAGVVTFLTMSYILLVNPQILSQVRPRCAACRKRRQLRWLGWSAASRLVARPHHPTTSIPPPPTHTYKTHT